MKRFIFLFLISFCCLSGQKNNEDLLQDKRKEDFQWQYASPESQGMSSLKLSSLVENLSKKGTNKLLIIKDDKIVCEWYAEGFEDSVKGHSTASLAKALVGGMSLLLSMNDRYINADEPACNFIPAWKKDNLKSKITIRHLATHTSGIEDAEVSAIEEQRMIEKGIERHMGIPGWKGQFWKQDPDPFSVARDSTPVLSIPGTQYAYSNPGIGMLTYAVTASLKNSLYKDIRTYLKERIYGPIGIKDKEYTIGYGKTFELDGLRIVPSWGGGTFTANSVARIGRLMLKKGNWQGNQLIDSAFVEEVVKYNGTALPVTSDSGGDHIPATTLGWYCNYNGVWNYVPRDAFAGAGRGNQLLLVVPSLNLIIVRFGNDLFKKSEGENFWLGAEKYLFNPVINAIEKPPYPQSDLITSCEFAPEETVVRMAKESDNWPLTWADDDNLYTAYGDGYGFLPFAEIKLSLGLAQIQGTPPDIRGINIRTSSGERVGDGKYGPKPSGLLMAGKILYIFARNLNSSQLAWSEDYGKKWKWADWKFREGFGCPTFLNFGKNYEGARDNYIYIYSFNEESAYKVSDQMIMARVPVNKIKDWDAYEYFAGFTTNNLPVWTSNIRKRQAVFSNPGKCYRSGITYSKGLKRYLWCQIIPVPSDQTIKDPLRYKGGMGIFEGMTPWGPWKTIYYTLEWDIGPGETASIPTKWMSEDGRTCYLVFSGNDSFSVRKIMFNRK